MAIFAKFFEEVDRGIGNVSNGRISVSAFLNARLFAAPTSIFELSACSTPILVRRWSLANFRPLAFFCRRKIECVA